jgi:hypothetical protein
MKPMIHVLRKSTLFTLSAIFFTSIAFGQEDISYVFKGSLTARYTIGYSGDFFAGEHTLIASEAMTKNMSRGLVIGIVSSHRTMAVPIFSISKAHPDIQDTGYGFTLGYVYHYHFKRILYGWYGLLSPRYTMVSNFHMFDFHLRLGYRIPFLSRVYLDGSFLLAFRPVFGTGWQFMDDPHKLARLTAQVGVGYGL